ncbi:PRC-barrel domain protein [Methanobrevibacter cuticularis]|uniref:PRC-barrel domain protein n=1 Tax=Methanobrevibacter cuticularis TaxID=47311 RepID=A0A166E4J4_9EURY|nr:PRC-barrel domain-containing protein [Methanobrevibacter cuticularis]KZX16271.1 PRC-barrel domain protein [Methanobrevibacter cuticularis]
MRVNKIVGMDVVDNEGEPIGKVSDIYIDEQEGSVKGIGISLDHDMFYYDEGLVTFDQIDNISDNVILGTKIVTE